MSATNLDNIISSLTESDLFSGVILVRKEGDDLFSGVYGYASRSWRIINSMDMAFPTASLTKTFTAVAVMQLVERGMLSIDSKVQNILKIEGSLIPPEITVEHLLMHTSGLPDYFEESGDDFEDYESLWKYRPNYSIRELSDFLPLIPNRFPAFEAGSQFSYCNTGYIILGLMIEKATKQSYFDYVEKNVFMPAGMLNSGFFSLDSVSENMVDAHIPLKDEEGRIVSWRKNIYTVSPRGASDGGAHSTAKDLIKFLRSLRECKLLSAELTQQMLTPRGHVQKEGSASWCYGYGIAFVLDSNGIVRYGHGGDDPGVSIKVFHYPAQNVDLMILGNQSHCAGDIDNQVHKMILEGQFKNIEP
jgi:CubicO group peptidase (beta-lactamase class C family)